MANKDILSVFGGKGTKVDVDDSYGGKGGHLTCVFKMESTKFETGNTAFSAAVSGGNNGSGWGQVHRNISLFFRF